MFRWWNWALNPLLSYQKHLQTNLKRDQNDDELHNYDSKKHYTYITPILKLTKTVFSHF